jgi:hypothetical protein
MGELPQLDWPLHGLTLLAGAWAVILIWLVVTTLVLAQRRSSQRKIVRLLEDVVGTCGPVSVYLPGEGEAVAVGPTHFHWIDCVSPGISFSLPLDDVTHLKVIDDDPGVMKLSFKLSGQVETRVLRTRDILQATLLFRLMQEQGKMIDYLVR